MLIDSHAHLYLEEFFEDIDAVIKRADKEKISKIILPNIDSNTIEPLINLTGKNPDKFVPLIGLHPTSVKNDYITELEIIEKQISEKNFTGIGEIGIDLYWDKTYKKEQEIVFKKQILWAKELNIPVVIHVRNSFYEIYNILEEMQDGDIRGIFHCFSGDMNQAEKIIKLGFFLGIGGVITFKNSKLSNVIKDVDINHIVLETDSPFLSPVPKRGKRNESSYLIYIAEKIAEIYEIPIEKVAKITTSNVLKIFNINN